MDAVSPNLSELRAVHSKLGEFCAVIADFWLDQVGHHQFVKTNFTELRMEIADPSHACPLAEIAHISVKSGEDDLPW